MSPQGAELPTIATMEQTHVAQVVELERRNYQFPWSQKIFADCVRVGYDGHVLHLEDQLIGYGILQYGPDEAHLLNICVDASYQRRGFALYFLRWLQQRAHRHGALTMFLEVRPSNPRAIELYLQNGFNEIARRRDYYDAPGGREDAVVMACVLFGTDDS